MIFAILLIGIILSIGLALSTIFINKLRTSVDARNSVPAYFAADSGIEWFLFSTVKGTPQAMPVFGIGSEFEITEETEEEVRSLGTFRGVSRAIEVDFGAFASTSATPTPTPAPPPPTFSPTPTPTPTPVGSYEWVLVAQGAPFGPSIPSVVLNSNVGVCPTQIGTSFNCGPGNLGKTIYAETKATTYIILQDRGEIAQGTAASKVNDATLSVSGYDNAACQNPNAASTTTLGGGFYAWYEWECQLPSVSQLNTGNRPLLAQIFLAFLDKIFSFLIK